MRKLTRMPVFNRLVFDAISPEFKAANDVLARIIKTNNKTGGVPYPRLFELSKAIKANDIKAAITAYSKLVPLSHKAEETLRDELEEAKSNLSDTDRQIETSKKKLAQEKTIAGLFDKFAKSIDSAKGDPKALAKLNVYSDKLKSYGDYSKRIMQTVLLYNAGKDGSRQFDALKKAVENGKNSQAKDYKLAESELAKLKNRLEVYKDLVKSRTKKVSDFKQESSDIAKLGRLLPDETSSGVQTGVQSTSEELDVVKRLYDELIGAKNELIKKFNAETRIYNKKLAALKRENGSDAVDIEDLKFPAVFPPWLSRKERMQLYREELDRRTARAKSGILDALHKLALPGATKLPKDFETFKKVVLDALK